MSSAAPRIHSEIHPPPLPNGQGTEEALREREALRGAFDDAPIGMSLTALDGRWVRVNQALCEIVGYSEAELLAMTFQAMTHPDDLALTLQLVGELLMGKRTRYQQEKRYMHRLGHAVWVSITVGLVRDDAGQPQQLLAHVQDVTERRADKEAMRQREALLRQTQEIAHVGSWAADLTAGTVRWSDELYRIYGLEPGELSPSFEIFQSLVHPADRERVMAEIERIVQRGGSFAHDHRLIRADGEERTLHCRGRALFDASGAVVQVIGSSQDITDRKAIEEELVRARDAAESANRAKSDFLSRMSHELRTPLNSVIGFANVLLKNRRGSLQPADLGYAQRIRANGMHLLGLVDDLLNIAKIEAGRIDVAPEMTDVRALVQEVGGLLEGQPRAAEVSLRIELPPQAAALHTDGRLLRQVLINLGSNALKFTRSGQVTLSLRADPITHQPLAIEVSDSGIGIPPDRMDSIFQPFEQVSNAAHEFPGTGLGLAICRSLCDALGFRLSVESEEGRGSMFRVELKSR
jgi:PAS domain S-box-containing protein